MTDAELRPPSGWRRYLPRGMVIVGLAVAISLGLLGLGPLGMIIRGGNGDDQFQGAIERAEHRAEVCVTHERPHACIKHLFRTDRASHTPR